MSFEVLFSVKFLKQERFRLTEYLDHTGCYPSYRDQMNVDILNREQY